MPRLSSAPQALFGDFTTFISNLPSLVNDIKSGHVARPVQVLDLAKEVFLQTPTFATVV